MSDFLRNRLQVTFPRAYTMLHLSQALFHRWTGPVYPTWGAGLNVIVEWDPKLAFTMETPVHADHITAALTLGLYCHQRMESPQG